MKYKVGDRVRIGKFKTKCSDKKQWQGKVMTIWAIQNEGENLHSYVMKEDNAKNSWYESMIKGLAEPEPEPIMTEILQMAIDTYGEDDLIHMVNEEMAELTVALNKYYRNPSEDTTRAVIEKIADVRIIIEQIAFMFELDNVSAVEKDKIEQLYNYLKKERLVQVIEGKYGIDGTSYIWINPDNVPIKTGHIAIAETPNGCAPIIVTRIHKEKLEKVKHYNKIIANGFDDE